AQRPGGERKDRCNERYSWRCGGGWLSGRRPLVETLPARAMPDPACPQPRAIIGLRDCGARARGTVWPGCAVPRGKEFPTARPDYAGENPCRAAAFVVHCAPFFA